jgi:hypothetical protein
VGKESYPAGGLTRRFEVEDFGKHIPGFSQVLIGLEPASRFNFNGFPRLGPPKNSLKRLMRPRPPDTGLRPGVT